MSSSLRKGWILAFFLAALLIVAFALSSSPVPPTGSATAAAWVEPGLQEAAESGPVRVIVMGAEEQQAARAVSAAGATITSDLWLIDGVAATLDERQLQQVAAAPGILAISHDRAVRAADAYQWPGWVTDRRDYGGEILFAGEFAFPPLALSNGHVLAVTQTGSAIVVREDSTVGARFSLPVGTYTTPPVAGEAGQFYIANSRELLGVQPDGQIIWRTTGSFSGLVLVDDVVLAHGSQGISAYETAAGHLLWERAVDSGTGALQVAAGAPGAGQAFVLAETGHLLALDVVEGSTLWEQNLAPAGAPYQLKPLLGDEGTIFVTGSQGLIYAFTSGGATVYEAELGRGVTTQPAAGDDGSLYVITADRHLIALEADGAIRYNRNLSAFGATAYSPGVSRSGGIVFVAFREGVLLGVDSLDGTTAWEHRTTGRLLASPVQAANGNLHLGDDKGVYEILAEEGLVLYRYGGFSNFMEPTTLTADGTIFFRADNARLVMLERRPAGWSEDIPYVEPTNLAGVYKIGVPLVIDMGADVAHENGVTGSGVGVAVVDSGVYFDNQTRQTLGKVVERNFLGQAEFVGDVACTEITPGSCFADYTSSYDGYGHGSHVAGIVWNNVRDYYTGVTLGIAP